MANLSRAIFLSSLVLAISYLIATIDGNRMKNSVRCAEVGGEWKNWGGGTCYLKEGQGDGQ